MLLLRRYGPRSRSGVLLRRIGTQRAGTAALFASVNRNKRSIALDLRRPEGRIFLNRLIARADVLVENFRPGAMERMGLGPGVLRANHRAWCTRA
jgi:crotonobetainyl-CoA:carnitine CoA-transferase CaiB-like acyl-CoA transferase